MPSLQSYDQAAAAARLALPGEEDAVNARWEKHLTAMTDLGAHEAGWRASTVR